MSAGWERPNRIHHPRKIDIAVRLAHFVYTKSETSPFKKTGFHFCAYTFAAFAAKDLLAVETHIHFPEISDFREKRTFFSLNGRPFVLFMTALPDERDSFGRGGMFIVHGMELPADIYSGHKSLARIVEALRGYAFTSRSTAFSSVHFAAATGDLTPLDVPDALLLQTRKTIPALSVAERAGLLVALKSAVEPEAALCLEAPPKDALGYFDKIFAWLPPEHKKRFAFDEAFDGGKLFFYPIKMTGYTKAAPVTGTPVLVARDSVGPPEATQRWATADGYFARWAGRETTPETLEIAWAADEFLCRKSMSVPVAPDAFIASFADANESELRRDAEKAANGFLEPALAAATARYIAPAALLKLKFSDFAPAAFAPVIESAVFQTGFFGTKALPDAYQTPLTRRISLLWENQSLAFDDVAALSDNDRQKFMKYLAGSVRAKETWACDLAAQVGVERETWEAMRTPLLAVAQKRLPAAFSSLKDLPAYAVAEARRLPADNRYESWRETLDKFCAGRPETWMRVAKSLKNMDPGGLPYLTALVRPEESSFAFAKSEDRRALMQVLRRVHGWGDERLKAAGFNDEEIQSPKNGGMMALLKKIIRAAAGKA